MREYSLVVLPVLPVNMAEQDEAPAAATVQCCSAESVPPPRPPHVVSVFGVCLFGVVLIADACVFGLCWLGGERARCRADGVPSAPCGPAVPSTLLSHRERRADRLLQGEHHFLTPSLSLSHTHREAASSPHISFLSSHPPSISHFFLFSSYPFFYHFSIPFLFLQKPTFSKIKFEYRCKYF